MKCGCGQPLHYVNPKTQAYVERIVADRGEFVPVRVIGPLSATKYWVPRHYIALHGFKAKDLPELVVRYGWKKMEEERCQQ